MDIESNNGVIAIVAISKKGAELGRRLRLLLSDSYLYLPERWATGTVADEYAFSSPVKDVVREVFHQYHQLILIMATGIAVRLIADRLRDKHHDPGVVVVDDSGAFVVSLLSGHEGGANKLVQKVAISLGACPVITTASDMSGTISVDMLGKEFGWEIENHSSVTKVSAAMVNGEPIGVYQDTGERNWWPEERPLPDNVTIFNSIEALHQSNPRAALIITDRVLDEEKLALLPRHTVVYRPKSLVVGIGCNRGTRCLQIEKAVTTVFSTHGLAIGSIRNIATIDFKQDERGLLEFAQKYCLPIEYFDKEALRLAHFPSTPSETVMKYVGTPAVCESAAILSSGNPSLIVPKESYARTVTVAVAPLAAEQPEKKGKLFLVGIGPGSHQHITLRAREAIEQSEVVVGYTTYIKLIEPFLHTKEVIATGMGAEVERANTAIRLAREGKKVAFVSSGDSGVYGMAGLVGEILGEQPGEIPDIEVVPGVTSLVAAAALLGSPITVDFATISLSDYLVSWQEITQRLEMAAEGDFVIILYNPRSRKRQHQLTEAKQIILEHRSPSTPVGIVTNAYRENQEVVVTTLEHMLDHEIGMDTIIIIGNSTTSVSKGWMMTPRGYRTKYRLEASA
ncbi:MAG: precorrin-3B C(17)-methyltransferase [Dehalococcoidales bacterium]|nr:precorrin-3B C(17)-methyltransferase [Dehalococcoidales bacterium]